MQAFSTVICVAAQGAPSASDAHKPWSHPDCARASAAPGCLESAVRQHRKRSQAAQGRFSTPWLLGTVQASMLAPALRPVSERGGSLTGHGSGSRMKRRRTPGRLCSCK